MRILNLQKELRIGCSGWSYQDWVGKFYPKNLRVNEYLSHYSSVFNCVEIDSSYYRIPSPYQVALWKNSTSPGFRFTAKFPKSITHVAKLEGVTALLNRFYMSIKELGEKLGPLVVQLPPSIKYDNSREKMEAFLAELDPKTKHTIEFRHKSWFNSDLKQLLEKYGVGFCWSMNQYLTTPDTRTTNFAYLRLVGDRTITKFGATQRDRSKEMKQWTGVLQAKEDELEEAYVFFNNHFAGFGPESVNEFRRLLGLMEANWSEAEAGKKQQRDLLDF